MNAENDTIQFRDREAGEAINCLKELRTEMPNVGKLACEGLTETLREVTSGDEKVTVFRMYQHGEIEEAVARVFLGDHLDTMTADTEEVRAAIDDDTSGLVQ